MVTETKAMTVKEWLTTLANSDQSDDGDTGKMQNLLRRVGFHEAVCTCGIVYLDGHGTLESPPTSIHSIAKMLLSKA